MQENVLMIFVISIKGTCKSNIGIDWPDHIDYQGLILCQVIILLFPPQEFQKGIIGTNCKK